MYFETVISLVAIMGIPYFSYKSILRPAQQMLLDEYEERGLICKRDNKLFVRQSHYFYSKKISNLEAVVTDLQSNPIKIMPLPGKLNVSLIQSYQQESITFLASFFGNSLQFQLVDLGELNEEYRYCFTLIRTRKISISASAYIYNVISTRIENILKKLDDSIEVQRKVMDYRTIRYK